MSGCGCKTSECSCPGHLHGYFLGAISPADATEQVFPASRVTGSAGHNAAARSQILASAAAGQVVNAGGSPDYIPGTSQCSAAQGSTGMSNVQLTQMSSGLALTGMQIGLTSSGLVTAAALAPWTMGISAIIGLFPILFGHHAQAVKKEQSVLCTAVPAANNYLQIIDQAVRGGHATPQQGIDALNSLLSDFESQVSSIRQGSSPADSGSCNAACIEQTKLHAVVLVMQSEYQDMINASAATPTVAPAPVTVAPAPASPSVAPVRPNVVAAPGTPTTSSYASFYSAAGTTPPAAAPASSDWLPIAAVAIGAFFLMRGL